MTPAKLPRWVAALFPPTLELNLACQQAQPQAQAHSCQMLLPRCLTLVQLGGLQRARLVLKAALKTSPSTEHLPELVPLDARLSCQWQQQYYRDFYLPFMAFTAPDMTISQQLTIAEIHVPNIETSYLATPCSFLTPISHHPYRKPQVCECNVKITQGILLFFIFFSLIKPLRFKQSCCAFFPVFPLMCLLQGLGSAPHNLDLARYRLQ